MMRLYQKLGLTVAAMLAAMTADAAVYLKLQDTDAHHAFTEGHRNCVKELTVTGSTQVPDEVLGLAAAENAVSRTLTLTHGDIQHLAPRVLYKMVIPVSPLHTWSFSGSAIYEGMDNELGAVALANSMNQIISHREINEAMDDFHGLCITIKPSIAGMRMSRFYVRGKVEQIDAATAAGAIDLPAAIVAAWQ